uniref:hypothetical protein n=1 Tax=Escherichia coli TaxID=562 RepID=UPI001954EF46
MRGTCSNCIVDRLDFEAYAGARGSLIVLCEGVDLEGGMSCPAGMMNWSIAMLFFDESHPEP